MSEYSLVKQRILGWGQDKSSAHRQGLVWLEHEANARGLQTLSSACPGWTQQEERGVRRKLSANLKEMWSLQRHRGQTCVCQEGEAVGERGIGSPGLADANYYT